MEGGGVARVGAAAEGGGPFTGEKKRKRQRSERKSLGKTRKGKNLK